MAVWFLTACAGPDRSDAKFAVADSWVGEGLLIVGGGEMQLFSDAADLNFPGNCQTIVARTAKALRDFRSLDHRVVVVRGRATAWPRDVHSISLDGNVIMNACNSNDIVFAFDIRPR